MLAGRWKLDNLDRHWRTPNSFRQTTLASFEPPLRVIVPESSEFKSEVQKWPRLFEQHFPIYKWIPGGLQKVLGAHRKCHLMRPAVALARQPDTFHLA
jgi:hypothetical protein